MLFTGNILIPNIFTTLLSEVLRLHILLMVNRVWFTSTNYGNVGKLGSHKIRKYLHAVQRTLVGTKMTQRRDTCEWNNDSANVSHTEISRLKLVEQVKSCDNLITANAQRERVGKANGKGKKNTVKKHQQLYSTSSLCNTSWVNP